MEGSEVSSASRELAEALGPRDPVEWIRTTVALET